MMDKIVLSHYQTNQILNTRQQGIKEIEVSLDLGITMSQVQLEQTGVHFTNGEFLSWNEIEYINDSGSSCFILNKKDSSQDTHLQKIQFYSETTDRVYSLYPTSGAPTMLISGIPMHRIKDIDPYHDTLEKIKTIRPLLGQVLDTATGLGYTAIQAARTAAQVTTVELDPAALQVAHLNPWSQGLFNNPKITQVIADSFDAVIRFTNGAFSRIIHDPPAFSLAGDLYSGDFYIELYRILSNGGKLFHYIGDPQSKSGRSTTASVIRRLQQVGFREVERTPRAFGVVATR
jgi:uncharacterized protein